jgi:dTDP-4-dehydrorhamnose reductase
MKVLILGASGIVGQTMRLFIPAVVSPVWVRRTPDPITPGYDLTDSCVLMALLDAVSPDVIVNLAGESSVDAVERDPALFRAINVAVPAQLALWAHGNGKRLIQVSSQAVWDGTRAPYGARVSCETPVNEYGKQKITAEAETLRHGGTILRLTFVLGIRPLPHVGRSNPLEAMLDGQSPQAADRFFSPLMAEDAAELIWQEVLAPSGERIRQFGQPVSRSRYEIAQLVNPAVEGCRHEDFKGLAARPLDTTYEGSSWSRAIDAGVGSHLVRGRAWKDEHRSHRDRAVELALFFGISLAVAREHLDRGFGMLHNEVTADFNASGSHKTEAELLDWYRSTEAYIWELSAYHEDAGFNYSGMCRGIAERLASAGVKKVLCLGDGIGDLTLSLDRAGFDATYHDLTGSRTAEYAAFRFWRHTGRGMAASLSETFEPSLAPESYDAVVSLDFLEHVTNVPDWAAAIRQALKPGAMFCAQNAFAIGSGADGSMPMHLAVNDRFEKDWDPLLSDLGFVQESSNWYRKAR